MNLRELYAGAYIAGVLWLAGWELSAFAIGRHDLTISDMTWDFEGNGWTAARFLVLAALIWLTLHLAFKWLR